jgi:hypothetical protein
MGAIPKKKADHATSLTNKEDMPTIIKGPATIFNIKKNVNKQDDTIVSIVTTKNAMIKKDRTRGVMPKKQADLTDSLTNIEAKPTTKKGRTTIFNKKKESPKSAKKAECNSSDEDLLPTKNKSKNCL